MPAEPVTQIARRRYSMDAARLFGWYSRLLDQQQPFRTQWQLLADYLDPNRTSITFQQQPGVKKTDKLFDSTAPHAAEVCASNIHGALTNPSQKFFSMTARQKELHEVQGVRAWCEETSDRDYMAINNSNHVAQVAEFYKDLVVFATGATLLEEGARLRPGQYGGHRYQTIPLGTYVIDENADERVDVLMRTITMSARAACEKWGRSAGMDSIASLPDRVRALADSRPEEPVEIIHAIYPRKDRDSKFLDARNMPFASCWFTAQEKHKIAEGGYHEFPGAVCRWTKNAGEKYGRGPSWIALPGIKSLNRAIELYLSAGEKAIEPPLMELYDSVIGPTSLQAAAINVVREPNAIMPLESKSRWDIAEAINERLERQINMIFMIDQFDSPATREMTATEAAIRNERTLRLLGPAAGRLMYEWFIPMREREIALMYRAGALPEAPDELAQNDADLDIIAEGPLARAQRAQDLVAIERAYTLVGHIANLTGDQSVFDSYDGDEAAKEAALVSGMPANISRDKKLIDAMRQARAQKAAADAKLQMIAQGAESLGKAAPGLKVLQGGQGQPVGEGAAA